MMIRKLTFWDFDGTLIDSPLPETGKLRWEQVKGTKYPALGWWSKTHSLDLDVFNIEMMEEMSKELIKISEDDQNLNVLLTNRIPKLTSNVLKVLENLNISSLFNDLLFAEGSYNKGQRIVKYLKNSEHFSTVNSIRAFDDMEEQITALESAREEIASLGISNYVVHHVKNGKI